MPEYRKREMLRAVVESLEARRMLAINPVGVQPTGPLSGKIVYTSGGHGWQWNNTLNRFATDRGDNNEIVEDFGNQEQMTYYADYIFRAGGTVVPMRPVGRQINEVVLDNDSAGVTFSGTWQNSTGARHYDEDYGAVADAVSYRFASTTATETATATYAPNIPKEGFYPVYTWVALGTGNPTNRTSQLYKINHTGGQMQVRVDHALVGNGWVYLGTYHFNAGSSPTLGSVQISNQGAAGKVAIADAIRFGNGMGDVPGGPGGIGTGSISGYPREDENSLHWLWRAVGQGASAATVIGTSNVSAPSRMAEAMHTGPFGSAVYIGFHSNAGGGRGAVGLMTTSASLRTPHQADLALFTGRQINQDMQALNGTFEHNWSTRTTHTYDGVNFGEIDEGPDAEMDMTIIEVAFHDSVEDAQLMRDPRVRDQLARSTYEATLEYFNNFGGVATTTTMPSAPINVRALSNASGAVTLNWSAGPTGVNGNAATGYRVYVSTGGYGFDGGTFFAGGGTTTGTITGLDPNIPHYFKVVAENAGGESKASEVIAALPSSGAKRVLIVNGFDRFDRGGNVRYPYAFTGDGLVDRVWPRFNNSFDYSVQVAAAIHAAKPGTHVASTSNEAVINGTVNLGDYHTVIWISGEESTTDDTFNATEQTKVEQFIAAGGNLFVTGAEIGWDLDQQNNGRTFYENTLKGNYVADDANTYNVSGIAGGIFAGLSFSFDNGARWNNANFPEFYNTDFPDVIAPQPGAVGALNYSGGAGGNAGIAAQGTGGRGDVVMFGFPFETITTAANRAAVMERVLEFFGTDLTWAFVDGSVLRIQHTQAGNTVAMSVNGANLDLTQAGEALSFPLAGFSSILIEGTSGNDTIEFTGPVAKPLTINGGTGIDQFNINAGSVTFATDASATTQNLQVTVDAGAAVVFDATQHLDALTVNGSATLTPGGGKVLVTRTLSISTGQLNLNDNDLIIDYSSVSPVGTWTGATYSGVTGLVKSGRNNGAWNGSGIISSLAQAADRTTLAVAEAADVFNLAASATATFSGQTVDATSVIVKYTWGGDATMDGKINVDDYGRIDGHVAQSGSVFGWFVGDFNYDGKINVDDYGIIDGNINSQDQIL